MLVLPGIVFCVLESFPLKRLSFCYETVGGKRERKLERTHTRTHKLTVQTSICTGTANRLETEVAQCYNTFLCTLQLLLLYNSQSFPICISHLTLHNILDWVMGESGFGKAQDTYFTKGHTVYSGSAKKLR